MGAHVYVTRVHAACSQQRHHVSLRPLLPLLVLARDGIKLNNTYEISEKFSKKILVNGSVSVRFGSSTRILEVKILHLQ